MRDHILKSIGNTILTGLALATAPDAGLKSAIDDVKPGPILEHIKVLASDEFEGRGPGTPGEVQTIAHSAWPGSTRCGGSPPPPTRSKRN